MKCIVCRSAPLEEHTTDMPAKVKGEDLVVPDVRALRCPNCGYKTIKGTSMSEYMRRAADVYREIHGLLTSDQIKARRKALDMNQEQFAVHIGNVGVASVKRWELGQVQDRAMDKLIRLTTDASEAKANYQMVCGLTAPGYIWEAMGEPIAIVVETAWGQNVPVWAKPSGSFKPKHRTRTC